VRKIVDVSEQRVVVIVVVAQAVTDVIREIYSVVAIVVFVVVVVLIFVDFRHFFFGFLGRRHSYVVVILSRDVVCTRVLLFGGLCIN
jgi:dolichyl-phosphate-mannose--protein O-mannosyl transferase